MKYKVIIFLLSLVLFSCGITDFEMPTWNVDLTSIPLMNEDFPASDLEGENILIEGDSLLAIVEDQIEEATPELSKNIIDSTPDVNLQSNTSKMIRFEIQSINTNTSFRIIQGTFDSGEMVFTFIGDTNNFTELILTFDQLVTEDNELLVLELQPEDFTNNQYIIELAGLSLIDQEIDGEFWLINIDVYAVSDLPTGDSVGQGKFTINDELFFREFIGFINDVRALDSETDVEIDYPHNVENAIILDEISMYFEVFNKIGFEFELMGELVAYRDGVEIDTIYIEELDNVDFTINASPEDGLEEVTMINVINNDRVNEMLRMMPDKVAFLNPTYKVYNFEDVLPGFVSNQHNIRSDYRIEIPLSATFNDDYLIYPDKIHEINISNHNQELIVDNVNSANIQLTLINEYPIGGYVDIFFSSEELEPDSLSLNQAELQFLGYNVEVSSEEQFYEIVLTDDNLNLFSHEKVFLRTRVRFHNSNGVVAILANDSLNLKGLLNISVKMEVD